MGCISAVLGRLVGIMKESRGRVGCACLRRLGLGRRCASLAEGVGLLGVLVVST